MKSPRERTMLCRSMHRPCIFDGDGGVMSGAPCIFEACHPASAIIRMNMRLQPKEVNAIALAARDAFTPGTAVFLFGSRVDDGRRGGDIDLLVEVPEAMPPAELVRRHTRFVSRIYRLLDEQRIDVVIATRNQQDPREVVATARREGFEVAQV